jgi:hypothetical protein
VLLYKFLRKEYFHQGHNNESRELEVEIASWSFCVPNTPEAMGKEGNYDTGCHD